jgi:WASH complex subunit 7
MAAIRDTIPVIERSLNNPADVIRKFEADIEQFVAEHVVNPLSKDIETDLRLHIHSHLQLEDRNPFKVALGPRHRP